LPGAQKNIGFTEVGNVLDDHRSANADSETGDYSNKIKAVTSSAISAGLIACHFMPARAGAPRGARPAPFSAEGADRNGASV
jgi:hypothetical protein